MAFWALLLTAGLKPTNRFPFLSIDGRGLNVNPRKSNFSWGRKNGDGVDLLRFLRKKENIGPLYFYIFKPLPY
jgi:hypothetical protein